MKISIDKFQVKKTNVEHLKKLAIDPAHWYGSGVCEYQLYAYLSTFFNNSIILDVGTRTGGSALALSYNDSNKIISYDLQEQGASNIKKDNIIWKIQDFRDDETLDYDKISIIMIDVDPHDGIQEREMFDFLREKKWKGILLLDDICDWPDIKKLWEEFEDTKLDVTEIGHFSGTGIVSFGSKYNLCWVK
jgi:hypothetical protein